MANPTLIYDDKTDLDEFMNRLEEFCKDCYAKSYTLNCDNDVYLILLKIKRSSRKFITVGKILIKSQDKMSVTVMITSYLNNLLELC